MEAPINTTPVSVTAGPPRFGKSRDGPAVAGQFSEWNPPCDGAFVGAYGDELAPWRPGAGKAGRSVEKFA